MLRRLACVIVVAALAFGAAGAAPASAADGRTEYLALGDSLAFGFQPSGVFDKGYVQQLYGSLHAQQPSLKLTNLGCPGQTSRSLVAGGKCPYPGGVSQLEAALTFLRAHRHQVRLVTIDIGGHDGHRRGSPATRVAQDCLPPGLVTRAP